MMSCSIRCIYSLNQSIHRRQSEIGKLLAYFHPQDWRNWG